MKKTHSKRNILIYGINPVSEALAAKQKITAVWMDQSSKNNRLHEIRKSAQDQKIQILNKTQEELFDLAQSEHQGVIAFLAGLSTLYSSLDDFFHKTRPQSPYFFVIADNITDPRNLGALIRSADHFGVT
ncbi:MAG: hypothetical protein OEZ36_04875, partial [Spirochaetota bacterium]|nr:hypothetical protein [Spirochaetota bacterium]